MPPEETHGQAELSMPDPNRHRPNPIALSAWQKAYCQEAGIPFFVMDQNTAARQESGNFFGWLSVRVPASAKPRLAKFCLASKKLNKAIGVRGRNLDTQPGGTRNPHRYPPLPCSCIMPDAESGYLQGFDSTLTGGGTNEYVVSGLDRIGADCRLHRQ